MSGRTQYRGRAATPSVARAGGRISVKAAPLSTAARSSSGAAGAQHASCPVLVVRGDER
ncbi:hypothetical protein ACWGH4_22915 [Streptomyces sp. NPDC054847]